MASTPLRACPRTSAQLDSALILVDLATSKFQSLDLSELQVIDPERGMLPPGEAHQVILTLLSDLSDARYASKVAMSHMNEVADPAERMYPKQSETPS